jgi:hypothetical protein
MYRMDPPRASGLQKRQHVVARKTEYHLYVPGGQPANHGRGEVLLCHAVLAPDKY